MKGYNAFVQEMFRTYTFCHVYVQPIYDSGTLSSAVCVCVNSGKTLAVWVKDRGKVWQVPQRKRISK